MQGEIRDNWAFFSLWERPPAMAFLLDYSHLRSLTENFFGFIRLRSRSPSGAFPKGWGTRHGTNRRQFPSLCTPIRTPGRNLSSGLRKACFLFSSRFLPWDSRGRLSYFAVPAPRRPYRRMGVPARPKGRTGEEQGERLPWSPAGRCSERAFHTLGGPTSYEALFQSLMCSFFSSTQGFALGWYESGLRPWEARTAPTAHRPARPGDVDPRSAGIWPRADRIGFQGPLRSHSAGQPPGRGVPSSTPVCPMGGMMISARVPLPGVDSMLSLPSKGSSRSRR